MPILHQKENIRKDKSIRQGKDKILYDRTGEGQNTIYRGRAKYYLTGQGEDKILFTGEGQNTIRQGKDKILFTGQGKDKILLDRGRTKYY